MADRACGVVECLSPGHVPWQGVRLVCHAPVNEKARMCAPISMPYAREPLKRPPVFSAGWREICIRMKGKTIKTMISEERIREVFTELAAIDSESFQEKEIGENVAGRLRELGLEVVTDAGTDPAFLRAHPDSFTNIFGRLKGNIPGEPVLFAAHLDTVAPGRNKQVVIGRDGVIRSAGDTVLGADDLCGITAILEALTVIQEKKPEHPDIEVLITTAEEPHCEGSRFFDYGLIRARNGYVLDLTGPIGTAAVAAPGILSFTVDIKGKAAHAGFAPEEGVNALTIAAKTLMQIPVGRIDDRTTANIGRIEGGTAINIVPENVRLAGEVRSLDHTRAVERTDEILKLFEENARKAGGIARCRRTEHVRAYRIDEKDPVVVRFEKACEAEKLESRRITTLGGSDANRLNEAGIHTIVIANGMQNVHSTSEFTRLDDITKCAKLTLKLMTIK